MIQWQCPIYFFDPQACTCRWILIVFLLSYFVLQSHKYRVTHEVHFMLYKTTLCNQHYYYTPMKIIEHKCEVLTFTKSQYQARCIVLNLEIIKVWKIILQTSSANSVYQIIKHFLAIVFTCACIESVWSNVAPKICNFRANPHLGITFISYQPERFVQQTY